MASKATLGDLSGAAIARGKSCSLVASDRQGRHGSLYSVATCDSNSLTTFVSPS